MLTVGEHDRLWIAGAKSLPSIENSLRIANAISCVKELHTLGEISDSEYKTMLLTFIKGEGFKIK